VSGRSGDPDGAAHPPAHPGIFARVRTVGGWSGGGSVARRVGVALGVVATVWLGACGAGPARSTPTGVGPSAAHTATGSATPTAASTTSPVPTAGPAGRTRPDHVVVVVFENKAAGQIDGSSSAPYFNSLMAGSAVLTESRAVAHPSQPNYLALFSGSTQDITDDRCPLSLGDRPNLGRQLVDAGLTFVGYSEGLPVPGYTGCSAGRYAAKHAPWVHFGNLPADLNQPATAFPSDYSKLPTVAFLIPDLCDDMHDCPVTTGDTWLREHVDAYVTWARGHNSLLVVTFDEDDNTVDNHILTVVAGAGVRPGRYARPVDHYNVLSTMDDWYGLTRLGSTASAPPISDIWR
jgi:hypothetical protein